MKERKLNHGYDIFHIMYGTLVVAFTIVALFDPQERYYAYSAVFLWTSFLLFNAGMRWWNCHKERPSYRIEGAVFMGMSIVFFVLTVASAITNWG